MNSWILLEVTAEAFPNRIAITFGSKSLTYRDLAAQSSTLARHLSRASTRSVVYVGENSPALPLAMYGAFRAGARFAPLNYRLADTDLNALVQRLDTPALLVVDKASAPRIRRSEGITVFGIDELLAEDKGAFGDGAATPGHEDVAVILYTSGTTGEPKQARLKHDHLTSYILNTVESLAAGEAEASLVCVPPYHIAAVSAMLSSVFAGRRIVYLQRFDPEAWIRAVREHRITHAMVVPTMLKRVLDVYDPESGDLDSLRHLAYGGGRMDQRTISSALEILPRTNFVNAYGLTETSSTVAVLGPDDHRRAADATDPVVRRRLRSVGKPVTGVEIDVRSADGQTLGHGVLGEIHVRGRQISGTYGDDNPRLRPGGWFPTRDQGWIDGEGFLYVEGRLDDVIVRGGENISPGEVEDVLRAHPDVADVAVAGVRDEEWGEIVGAAVVLKPGSTADVDELADHVRARLRSIKVPTRWLLVDDLPFSETGKLVRTRIRELLAGAAG
jgi:acyl-CoA synthetase (AMP-forming)/AMP-acid ligase II